MIDHSRSRGLFVRCDVAGRPRLQNRTDDQTPVQRDHRDVPMPNPLVVEPESDDSDGDAPPIAISSKKTVKKQEPTQRR